VWHKRSVTQTINGIAVDRLSSLRVLIVDDHSLVRRFMHLTLSGLGVSAIQSTIDGGEAIKALQGAHASGEPFHVVFLDWTMPVVSGLEVLSYFRGLPEFSRTAFVMLTAESEQRQIMRAIKAGATSYLVKPVDAKTVRLRLIDVCDWLQKNPR
jgi:two-component system chemotaxis response regulator CheY